MDTTLAELTVRDVAVFFALAVIWYFAAILLAGVIAGIIDAVSNYLSDRRYKRAVGRRAGIRNKENRHGKAESLDRR